MFFKSRKMHEWFAKSNGYFWLPCPICGEEFGGHEWRDYDGKSSAIFLDPSKPTGTGICPTCTKDGLGEEFDWVAYRDGLDKS